jgi:CheY-like chemotaxis protein
MQRGSVLVVDDDAEICAFISVALEDEGYQVITAVNGAALKIAEDRQPGVILLDILMPGMDGVEVSKRLRANPRTAHIPIIAMSAQDRLRSTGGLLTANDRLPKPFDLDRLYETVARWSLTL